MIILVAEIRQNEGHKIPWTNLAQRFLRILGLIRFGITGSHKVEDFGVKIRLTCYVFVLDAKYPRGGTRAQVFFFVADAAILFIFIDPRIVDLSYRNREPEFLDNLLVKVIDRFFRTDDWAIGIAQIAQFPTNGRIKTIIAHVGVHDAQFKLAILDV